MDSGVKNERVDCVVEYDYEAEEIDELSLHIGDIIRNVEKLPGGWWRGDLRGKRGMFPDNFVRALVVGEDETPTLRGGNVGRCRAVFSYKPDKPDELILNVGDTLEVLGKVEEGWWQGRDISGRIGVFPSNFVVLLDPSAASRPISVDHDAPLLPPKPVRELCRVLFPYTAVNEDELSLAEGEVVTLVSREAPDRGWWRGELRGRVGFFPDNFVQVIPNATPEPSEKKPERPPAKVVNASNLPVSKFNQNLPSHKDTKSSTLHKQETHSTIISQKEKKEEKEAIHIDNHTSTLTSTHNTTVTAQEFSVTSTSDSNQLKKPPVPVKKSTSPISGSGLLSGLKQKVLGSDSKNSTQVTNNNVITNVEADKPDGGAASRLSAPRALSPLSHLAIQTAQTPASNTAAIAPEGFDQIERNSILNDPRAGRVKAPRRRLPTQAPRDEIVNNPALSNGLLHEEKNTNKIVPKKREWELHKAPWMEELKLNQAKKTSPIADIGKSKSVSNSESTHSQYHTKSTSSSTDKLVECGAEEIKKDSSHSIEMSKSMSSIATKSIKLETFEEDQVQLRKKDSFDNSQKKTVAPQPNILSEPSAVEVSPPTPSGRSLSLMAEIRPSTPISPIPSDQSLIAQLNNRISNLEKLVETQNSKFTIMIEELTQKLVLECERRTALQKEIEKLAHCVTQV